MLAVDDPALGQVVGRHLDDDLVPREDLDVVHAHLAGHVGQHQVPVLQLDPEHGVWKGFLDGGLHPDGLFLDHKSPEKPADKSGEVYKTDPGRSTGFEHGPGPLLDPRKSITHHELRGRKPESSPHRETWSSRKGASPGALRLRLRPTAAHTVTWERSPSPSWMCGRRLENSPWP